MKAILLRYAERIDSATLRERAMIFIACAALLAFLAYSMVLQPARVKQQRLVAKIQVDQVELNKLRTSIQGSMRAATQDPDVGIRARETALRETLAQLNARVAQEQRRFTAPENMRAVLEEILERNRRLTLVDLHTLPATSLSVRGAVGTPGLYRHGLMVTVSGSYGDLHDYLKALERLPTQIYWGRAEFEVTSHPAITLKLTVYTVSFDRAWLIV